MNSKLNKTTAKSKILNFDKFRNKFHWNRSYNGGEQSHRSLVSSTAHPTSCGRNGRFRPTGRKEVATN